MKFRILRKDGLYYVQRLEFVPDVSGICDMSREEWVFVKQNLFFKRKFVLRQCAEDYIRSVIANCEDYEVISEH